MAYPAVISLMNTLNRLTDSSSPVSFASPCLEIFKSSYDVLESLQKNFERKEDKTERWKFLDREVRDAVFKLEDLIESTLVSQSESQKEHTDAVDCLSQKMVECDDYFREISMAYSAVISLMKTMRRLERNYASHFLFEYPCLEIFESAGEVLESLQTSLEQRKDKSESERWKFLEGEVTEAVFKLKDVIESTVVSPSESESQKELTDAVDCLSDTKQKMVQYLEDEDEDDGANDLLSSTAYVSPTEMVGFTDVFAQIRDELLLVDWGNCKHVIVVGMAGSGKTVVAKKILEDPLIVEKFYYRFFIPVGQGSGASTISKFETSLGAMTDQMNKKEYTSYWGRKHLIVFDDVWELKTMRYRRRHLPPGSAMIVTTRLNDSDNVFNRTHRAYFKMPFLNVEESWNLLCGEVFGQQVCPRQLENAGNKIAQNCAGLPLLIVTVADVLSRAARTLEHWEKIADADIYNPVFTEAFDRILEVLYPSYYFLPHYAKPFFLYTAVFPPNNRLRPSRLFALTSVEEFTDPNCSPDTCLEHLTNGHVVVEFRHRTKYTTEFLSLHPVFWYLCKEEAGNNKFFHILNKYDDCLAENLESQRRLCIYQNVLFGIKDVYNSMASVSKARSLLCTGAYHQYQVPICFGSWRLLKILDALTIRFYEFPMEVVELVLLRYLALTSNDNLPPSISNLQRLRFLIVHQHLNIKRPLAKSYLPTEIWHLQELEHLEIRGRDLPDPPHGTILPKLLKLLDVGPHSCSKSVLKSIPNLNKLRVQIEVTPGAAKPLNCFDHIFHLCESGKLQIIIVNPEIVAAPPLPVFKSQLRKLTLSGFGYPWKELNKLAQLPLEVLKLQCYAFRGEYWVTERDGFKSLRYLLIEDCDLVKWTKDTNSFGRYGRLTLKNCYKLKNFCECYQMELFDCNPAAEQYARNVASRKNSELYINSSWDQ